MRRDITCEDLIKQSFPFKEIRDIQKRAIEASYKHLNDQKVKCIVLELPTGTGKSGIAMTLADLYDKVRLTTPQKILQDQYMKDFSDKIELLKGRSEYPCNLKKGCNCGNAPCILEKSIVKNCLENRGCNYYSQLSRVQQAHIGLFNVHSYYFQRQYAQRFLEKADLMIVDECHLLESTFMGIIELKLIEKGKLKIPKDKDLRDMDKLLAFLDSSLANTNNQLNLVAVKLSQISDVTSSETITLMKMYEELVDLSNKISFVKKQLASDRDNWIFQTDYTKNNDKYILFKPIYVSQFVKDAIFSSAEKFVVMSATVIDIDNFCSSIGLDRNEVKFIRSGSPFPVENRPIYLESVGSMSYKNKHKSLPGMIRRIQGLLEEYPDVRGIVHTNSFEFMNEIKKSIKDKRLVFKEGPIKKVLEKFESIDNAVLVGPAMEEGLDLKDDLCRFQIVMKTPYPSLGDPQVKRRFEISKSWYNYLTVLKIIQIYGRGIRHVDDKADTYILDSDFKRLYGMARRIFPLYFVEAVVK